MDTLHLPASRGRFLLLSGLGLTAIAAGLLVGASPSPAGAAQVTTFCADGGAIPNNDTSTGLLIGIPVDGVNTHLTDLDVLLDGLDEDAAGDLDAFVAAPNGRFSYLVSDVGGTSTLTDVDVELDDEAASGIGPADGSFVPGTFRPSNRNPAEDAYTYPAGFSNGPHGDLTSLDRSNTIGTWQVWLVDDADNEVGTGGSIDGVCLEVSAGNNLPTAQVIPLQTTPEDTALPITLLGGDDDDDPLTYSIIVEPAAGHITQVSGADWLYTPPTDFNNPEPAEPLSFTYRVSDGRATAANTGTIRVMPEHDNPIGVADDDPNTYTVDEDGTLEVTTPGVLGNDTDVDGDPLAAALATGTTHGDLSFAPDGSFTYTPDADFHGTDSFTYTADDEASEDADSAQIAAVSGSTTVTITVVSKNDLPVAADDAATVSAGASHDIVVLGNDSDVDGDLLGVVSNTAPARGSANCTVSGCTYVAAAADPGGVVTFDYTVTDGHGGAATATVSITVLAGATAPPTTTATTTPTTATPTTHAPRVRSGRAGRTAGSSQIPRTGIESEIWQLGLVLTGSGLCTTGAATILRTRTRRRRGPFTR